MASVKLKPGESQEALLRRFRKRVTNAGILSTVRRKRWHISKSELRRIDPASGAVLERLAMPPGTGVSGLESDGADLFYCGGGGSGKLRAVRRPKRAVAAATSTPV